ncbi:MAG: ribonuclease III [Lachnospiraceae bacterium]|nr:ribonuclease III [Lachnospiraceae bacterium]MBR4575025.1 ribonuclease III [Lachnospiraceae bacterium]
MESGMIDGIKERFGLTGDDPSQYSPLALAFIGDSIYGAVVKTAVVLAGNCSANRLDAKAVKIIKAVSQAKAADYLTEQGLLREEELAIYKRGRNAKSQTVAKNAPVGDYRKATGLEALIGWLYLRGDMDRVLEIIKIAADVSGN